MRALLDAVPDTHVLRDPTRGGLATALCEIALSSNVGIRLEEAEIPVREEVRGACELLGFDPLYVACEGRFLAIVPGERAEAALAAVRSQPGGEGARRIGIGRRRGPRPPGAADADRQPPPARAALRRAAAEDLLMLHPEGLRFDGSRGDLSVSKAPSKAVARKAPGNRCA